MQKQKETDIVYHKMVYFWLQIAPETETLAKI